MTRRGVLYRFWFESAPSFRVEVIDKSQHSRDFNHGSVFAAHTTGLTVAPIRESDGRCLLSRGRR